MTITSQSVSSVAPKFGTIDTWTTLSGTGRRATYDALGHGHLKAVKAGTRTLIKIEEGLAWLESLPPANAAPRKPRKSTNN